MCMNSRQAWEESHRAETCGLRGKAPDGAPVPVDSKLQIRRISSPGPERGSAFSFAADSIYNGSGFDFLNRNLIISGGNEKECGL